MRVLGLALAGGLAVTTSVAADAVPLGSTRSDLGWFRLPLSSKRGVAVVGAGTLCPDIGASGEGDGFRRIVRRTAISRAEILWGWARPIRRMALLRRLGGLVRGLAWVRWRLIIISIRGDRGSGSSPLYR